jgi:hypothetical protein
MAAGRGNTFGTYYYTFSGGEWSAGKRFDPYTYQDSISCPSTSFCMAVDSTPGISPADYRGGYAFTYTAGRWSDGLKIDPNGDLSGVSCFSTSFCAAVDESGYAFTYAAGHWSIGHRTGAQFLYAVSCASQSNCDAVGLPPEPYGFGFGSSVIYSNGVWSTQRPFAIDRDDFLLALSCPSTEMCVALSTNGDASVEHYGIWSNPQQVVPKTETPAVSCSSPSSCRAVGGAGESTYLGRTWSAIQDLATKNLNLASMSCSGGTFCMAVGWNVPSGPNAFAYSIKPAIS